MKLERLEIALSLMKAQSRIIGKGMAIEFSGLGQEQAIKAELAQIHKEIESQALQTECEAIFEFALRLNTPILNLTKEALNEYHTWSR